VRTRGAISLVVGAILLLAAPSAASAQQTITPTTFQDGTDSFGCTPDHCTLREAVEEFQTDRVVQLLPGTYELSIGAPLPVDGAKTINGAGARLTTIDGNNLTRVVTVIEGATAVMNDVTITGGNGAAGSSSTEEGGGIWVDGAASVSINRSAIVGNSSPTLGGGIYASGTLEVNHSTIAGNSAGAIGSAGSGGGVYGANTVRIRHSTISGNSLVAGTNGAGLYSEGVLELTHATIAGNAAPGNSLRLAGGQASTVMTNTIVAADTGAACSIGRPFSGSYNLDDDGTCGFIGPNDRANQNPLLGPLQDNGGPTNTVAISAGSPAIGAANPAMCTGTDQRGIARPQSGACDIGAFEYVAPTLTVTTTVTNNDGGEDGPADFSVRVMDGAGTDVAGSPQPGSATGTTYTLAPGSFTVSADGPNLYTLAVGGACSAAGAVTLGESQTATCTVTANDRAPVAGRSVGAIPVRGTVRVKRPGGRFRVLREGDLLPNGTTIDTRKGRVTLIAAANKRGKESKADFYDGVFKLRQSKGSRPTTTLTLVEKLRCPKAGSASIAAKRKKKRRLWGDGSGKFRTKGKHSAATVVGTKWLVEDRCASTLTRVVRGRVKVRDFVKKKTVTVRKGKRYIARARD
jgi:predicted outer membrane repeat protein